VFILIIVRLRVKEVMCCQQYFYYKKCSEDTLLLCFTYKFIYFICIVHTLYVNFSAAVFLSTIDPLKIGYGVDYVGLCVVAATKCM
jgi:hypothetical protein